MANEYVGSALYAQWVWATGTTTLNTDFRTFTYTPSVDFIDVTAGADSGRQFIQGFKGGAVTCEMLMLNSIASADVAGYTEGVIGTLTWGPAGTAAGKVKHVIPAICQGMTENIPYGDVVTISVSWNQNGGRTDGTY